VKQSGRGDVRASVEVLKLRGLYGSEDALDDVVIPRSLEELRKLSLPEQQRVFGKLWMRASEAERQGIHIGGQGFLADDVRASLEAEKAAAAAVEEGGRSEDE
jgi:hypothetical protein